MRFDDFVFVYRLRDERQIAWHGRLHSHDAFRYELHYFLSGEGSFRDKSAVFTIEPGRLYVTPPGSEHQIAFTNPRMPVTYYAVLLDAAGDEEAIGLLEGLARPRGPYALGDAQRFFFADLQQKRAAGRDELERAARYAILSFLYGLAGGQYPAEGRADPGLHVKRALSIMQREIGGSLDLEELCERINLSREHFVRLFASRMGMPPMRYYARLKVEAARAMLSGTSLRVSEISNRLGYCDQFCFARAFKRVAGLSPSRYRAGCPRRAGAEEGPRAPPYLPEAEALEKASESRSR